ncbi:MAG: hypothetical protein SVY53_10645 [Chloroflexota bacterium]|nr:hypothetical protein [Chloroflexota bacterium]
MEALIGFLFSATVLAAFLWLGAKITRMRATFLALFVAAAISAALGLVGGIIGFGLSLLALLVLVSAMTGEKIWPDVVCTVAAAWGIQFVLGLVLLTAIIGD